MALVVDQATVLVKMALKKSTTQENRTAVSRGFTKQYLLCN